jgi:hypothetical protein
LPASTLNWLIWYRAVTWEDTGHQFPKVKKINWIKNDVSMLVSTTKRSRKAKYI